ncbi:MAG: MFS transporter, partial [Thermoguttaceae bacterium]|nr:MFS transporter [Thermoguttaceae bacterium]
MSEQTVAKPGCVIPRLQLAYLLQFAIWGSWSIALGGYMFGKMTGGQIGALYQAVPIGAIVAPLFIGPIADRFFSAQKMLGVLHLISGAALIACGVISAHAEAAGQAVVPFWPIMILMLISGLCYMPSIPLINAVVFKHVPESSKQPGIFIFGTVGWILVCLLIEVFAGGAAKPNFFFIGGGCGLALGLYAFTLPNTPPKGAPAPGEKRDALGLGALKMFGDPKFTIFVLCAFAVSIFGSNFYFPALVSYLSENGFPAPVALGTLNQFSELFFMALLAVLVSRIGLKWVLVLGMSAWAARYIIFSQEGFQFALVGLLLHGMAYAYLYTAAYMFGDKVAPDNLKASVQSLLAFLLLGIGQLLSGLFFGTQIDDCQAQMTKIDGIQIESQQTQVDVDQLYRVPMDKISWSTKDAAESPMRFFNLIKSLKYLEGDKNVFDLAEYDLANFQNDDGTLNLDAIGAVGNDAVFGETETARIGKDELKAGFVEVAQKCEKDVSRLTREDWLNVQKHDKLSFLGSPVFRVPMANVSWSAKDAAENPLRF